MGTQSGLQPNAGNGAYPLGDSNDKVTQGVCGGVVVVVSSRRLHLADILLSCVGCFASFKDLAQLPRPFLNAPVPVFTAGDILSPLLKSEWPPRSCCRHKKIMRPCDPGGLPRQNMNNKESGVWRSSRSAARSCVVVGRKPFERPP
jgi:hypothetical protein